MDNTEQTVDDAFEMIGRAINRIGDADDIDVALDDILDAVIRIDPYLLIAAEQLTTGEIGEVMAGFSTRSKHATEEMPGNTAEQAFLVMVLLGEIKRRSRRDGLTALEWCRRERIKGFLGD